MKLFIKYLYKSPLTNRMASYNLFFELSKAIGATRMLELCQLYIMRHQHDASGSRIWRDCSDSEPFENIKQTDPVFPPAWRNMAVQTPKVDYASLPGAPKKPKQIFQSPMLNSSYSYEEQDTPSRRLSFSSLDELTAPALFHTVNSRGEYSPCSDN